MSLKRRLRSFVLGDSVEALSNIAELSEGEEWWRDRFIYMESHGYRLQERLRPGWIPSWKTNPHLRPEDCDDAAYNLYPQITYAIRIHDGSQVVIKKVSSDSTERSIAVFLSSEGGEDNHCVPIIDVFPDEVESHTEFVVMPLLRTFDSPPFYRVNEVVDFIRQTLEGIASIHRKNVAHRDCSYLNIMLDGSAMFPDGFHPIYQNISRAGRGSAKFFQRSDVKRVKYYFTDFGISTRFDSSDERRLVTGCRCQVYAPELSDAVPYDAFALDIYLLGDVYRTHIMQKYANVQFLRSLVDSMVKEDPKQRPDAGEALKMLDDLVSGERGRVQRWRLIDVKSSRLSRLVIDITCFRREGILVLR